MRTNTRFIFAVVILLSAILYQCKSQVTTQKSTYDSIATAKVGKPFLNIYNKDHSYSLVKSTDSVINQIRYAVINLKDNEVVLEGFHNRGGYVKWVGKDVVEVLSIPSHVTTVKDSTFFKKQIFLEGIKRSKD